MNENWNLHFPEALSKIRRATEAAGFRMASDGLTGSLLRSLAASKPKGALLELGTGTGMGFFMAPFRNGCFLDARHC